ncbi:MAG: redoxin domain-containing protein [Caulobacteraceae bacterium]
MRPWPRPSASASAAPDFTVKDVGGKTQSIHQYRGKIVVLDWVDPECSFDLKHYTSGNIPSMQKEAKKEGIVWLSINSAGKGLQGDFAGAQLAGWQHKVDWSADSYIRDQNGQIGKAYHATATPGMYVIKKDGTLAYAGAIDSIASNDVADIAKATNYVKQALAEIQAGKPVSVPVSRQYGCTIKYAG